MTKREVRARLDEIVAFAGLERFMDTPVKRYSSGMYLRLGFAIAAHMEAEILLVDEVLAVGDVEFQRRCLGKMDEVERSGRTVLFVSHNMDAMARLCTTTMWLDKGRVRGIGPTADDHRGLHPLDGGRVDRASRSRSTRTVAAQVVGVVARRRARRSAVGAVDPGDRRGSASTSSSTNRCPGSTSAARC